jgi:hypothetical protein
VALNRKSGGEPLFFAAFVITYIFISKRRQFTGGFFRKSSRRARAINYDISFFIRQKLRRKFPYAVRREIYRVRQMRMTKIFNGQNLDERETVSAIYLRF